MRTGEHNGQARRQSVLGLAGESHHHPAPADGDDLFGEPLSRRSTQGVGAERGSERPGARARGMSGTLNELWRGLRGQSSREDVGGEQAQTQREDGGESSSGWR